MRDLDVSYPRDHAEFRLGIHPNTLSLDELAQRLSLASTLEPVTVRDHTAWPIRFSHVYYRSQRLPQDPYGFAAPRCVYDAP